ncbi:hypothetical protein DFH28DRAFT_926005 [Melampsora americana]|nr:hypothetical protein DFH28DRAFT_926005 [Melampsora americana]
MVTVINETCDTKYESIHSTLLPFSNQTQPVIGPEFGSTLILVYNLDPAIPDNPPMSSLLLSVMGLPGHLHNCLIPEVAFGSLWSHISNNYLKITAICELSTKPLTTFYGARVFEVIFKQQAAYKWFSLLAYPDECLPMSRWDHKGNQTHHTINTQWAALPSCENCGASLHRVAH